MNSWKELEVVLDNDIINQKVALGIMTNQISLLIHLKACSKYSSVENIQSKLLAKFNVEYSAVDIENELICLNAPEIQEIEEDFYGGF